MLDAVMKEVPRADIFISTAAVADYKPAPGRRPEDQESLRSHGPRDGAHRPTSSPPWPRGPDRPLVVGFAAETESVEQNARAKLLKKNLDMIAANEVGDGKAFDCEDNHLVVLSRSGRHDLGQAHQDGARAAADRADLRGARRARPAPDSSARLRRDATLDPPAAP